MSGGVRKWKLQSFQTLSGKDFFGVVNGERDFWKWGVLGNRRGFLSRVVKKGKIVLRV